MKHRIPFIMICGVILSVFIQSCALNAVRQVKMDAPIPDAYHASDGTTTLHFTDRQWWLSFNDETLSQLMDTAFARNLELAQSSARLQQAMALSRQRRADRLPNINLEGSTSRSQQVDVMGESIGNSSSYSLAAGYEVDLW